jgi:phytoene/squalene synthetase
MNTEIAKMVRRHDPDRFLTALFAPPDKRDALLTLYAFNHELARAREVASEPHMALIRLQWWREVGRQKKTLGDGVGQRDRDLMPAARSLHDLPPPLQADQGHVRFAGDLPCSGEFVVERV